MKGVGGFWSLRERLIARYAREQIRLRIEDRIAQLWDCSKDDNCAEFAAYLELYVEEWFDD